VLDDGRVIWDLSVPPRVDHPVKVFVADIASPNIVAHVFMLETSLLAALHDVDNIDTHVEFDVETKRFFWRSDCDDMHIHDWRLGDATGPRITEGAFDADLSLLAHREVKVVCPTRGLELTVPLTTSLLSTESLVTQFVGVVVLESDSYLRYDICHDKDPLLLAWRMMYESWVRLSGETPQSRMTPLVDTASVHDHANLFPVKLNLSTDTKHKFVWDVLPGVWPSPCREIPLKLAHTMSMKSIYLRL
jgi:hypothetical protein